MNKSHKEPSLVYDDYWIAMAFMIAASSKNLHQGAVIIGPSSELLSMACDGLPKTIQNLNQNQNHHTIPAEINAIFKSSSLLQNGIIYLTHTPCYNSCLVILAASIKRIVYFPTTHLDKNCSEVMRCSYAQIEEFHGNLNWMRDYIQTLDIFNCDINK